MVFHRSRFFPKPFFQKFVVPPGSVFFKIQKKTAEKRVPRKFKVMKEWAKGST
jgi:hypothetical protein